MLFLNSSQECIVMEDIEMNDILPSGSGEQETQNSANVNVVNENHSLSLTGEKPYIGLEFRTHDEAYNYYNSYAFQYGFGIRKESIDKSRSDPNRVISRTFVCNKAGKKRMTDKRELGKLIIRKPDKRVGCGAKMKIKWTTLDTWVVTKFVGEHTHDITSPNKVIHHYSHRKQHRTMVARSYIQRLSEEGITASNISRVLNVTYGSQDGSPHFTPQQCTDHIRKTRKNNIGNECISIIKNFQDRRATDSDFYFAMEVDHLGMMRSVFWADGRSRSSYLSFGDVVVFDVTYRTNNLCLPFAPFTGVNHHRQSTLFGCALLADEQEDTFVWLFTQWLKCMHGLAPKAIITDQDPQIGGAIAKVFPNTRHRFCSWHISKHIAEKEVLLKSQYGDEFSKFFNNWYRASTISKCEERWKALKEKFEIDENASSWLSKMYRLREHWVNAYLKDVFWAGMTSSQRSESINAFFDGFVNSRTQLMEFVCQYDKAIKARRASEAHEDFMNLNNAPQCVFHTPLKCKLEKHTLERS